jgi:hypothetical protein
MALRALKDELLKPDLDPVCAIRTCQHRFQIVPSIVIWRSFIDALRNAFQQSNRDISEQQQN